MFKNREIRIRVAKTNDNAQESTQKPTYEFPKDDVIDTATQLLKTTAICVGAVIVAAATVHIVEAIAIHHGTKN